MDSSGTQAARSQSIVGPIEGKTDGGQNPKGQCPPMAPSICRICPRHLERLGSGRMGIGDGTTDTVHRIDCRCRRHRSYSKRQFPEFHHPIQPFNRSTKQFMKTRLVLTMALYPWLTQAEASNTPIASLDTPHVV